MRIIIAPDKFKGSMTALEAATAMAEGVKSALPEAEIIVLPISDGGEGLVDALTGAGKGDSALMRTTVTGPLGDPVEAKWGLLDGGRTAVVEMSAASGLTLVPTERRNPAVTTTYGTGELIKAALDRGCNKLIVGIGGSATNDGGAGMAEALGAVLYDAAGEALPRGGAALINLERLDLSNLDPRLKNISTLVACDVDNPLTGPRGASFVYGPQKGASPETVAMLDRALERYAGLLEKELGLDLRAVPGAGAAGGLGAGLIAFLGARLRSGIELVLDTLEIDRYLATGNLLITGEGKFDTQSLHGKAPVGVARRARAYGVPVIVLAGSLEGDPALYHQEGITACFALGDRPMSLQESIDRGPHLAGKITAELLRLWRSGRPL